MSSTPAAEPVAAPPDSPPSTSPGERPQPDESTKTTATEHKTPRPAPGKSLGVEVGGNIQSSFITIGENVILGSDYRAVSLFAASEHAEAIPLAEEITRAGLFVYDEGFVDTGLKVLTEYRLLLLIGEVGSGKESLARYLASRLRGTEDLEKETLLVRPLASEVRINLDSIPRHSDLHSRVVLFPDALERGHSGLRDFIMRLKGDGVNSIGRMLQQTKTYLIITATEVSLPPDCLKTLPLRLRPSIPALSGERVLLGVRHHITQFRRELDPALAENLTPQFEEEIAKSARSMSRAVLFIQSRLLSVLRNETTMQKAFDELDATVSWFENSAGSDHEAWIFALSLTLAHSLGWDNDIPWTEFAEFYDAIREHLLRGRKKRETVRPFDDDHLRAQACAIVERDPLFPQDVIRFRETGVARRLWNILLTRFRHTVNRLVPVLLKLTENPNVLISARAAEALGRIGYLDAGMTGSWIRHWANSDDMSSRALSGYVAVGVLSVGNALYGDHVLELLDEFAASDKHARTAIIAYRHIGRIDLSLALDRLRKTAQRHVAPALEENRDFQTAMDQLQSRLSTNHPDHAPIAEELVEECRRLYGESMKEKSEIAASLQYVLVALAITEGLAPVLSALSQWTLDSDAMGAIVAIAFLIKIAPEMTRYKRKVLADDGDGVKRAVACSVFVASLIADSQAVATLAAFMEAMCAALLKFFPMNPAAALTHVMFDYLKTWIKESLDFANRRAAMVELMGRLLNSNLRDLYDRFYDWLSGDPAFATGEMALFRSEARAASVRLSVFK